MKSKPVSLNALREALRLIRATREMLGSERRWTKGALARRRGKPVLPGASPSPTEWCLLGAVLEVEHRRSGMPKLERNAEQVVATALPRRLRIALEALRIGCVFTILVPLRDLGEGEEPQQPEQQESAEGVATAQPEEVEPFSASELIAAANDLDSTTYEVVLAVLDLSERLLRETIAERLAKRTTSKPTKRAPTSGKEREGR